MSEEQSGFEKAYKTLLRQNTQLNAELATVKGQFNEALENLTKNLTALDKTNKALETAVVQALREEKLNSDQQVLDWITKNKVPLALRIVEDKDDEFFRK